MIPSCTSCYYVAEVPYVGDDNADEDCDMRLQVPKKTATSKRTQKIYFFSHSKAGLFTCYVLIPSKSVTDKPLGVCL